MRFLRKDLAHAALRIFLVAVAPRNKVDMRMVNRLPRALTAIHSDIKAADADVALLDTCSCPLQQTRGRFDFGAIHIEISRDVSPRNYQAMPVTDGIVIGLAAVDIAQVEKSLAGKRRLIKKTVSIGV